MNIILSPIVPERIKQEDSHLDGKVWAVCVELIRPTIAQIHLDMLDIYPNPELAAAMYEHITVTLDKPSTWHEQLHVTRC